MRVLLIIAAVAVYLLAGLALAYFLWDAELLPDDALILLIVAMWPVVAVFAMLFWLVCGADSLVLILFLRIRRWRRNRK